MTQPTAEPDPFASPDPFATHDPSPAPTPVAADPVAADASPAADPATAGGSNPADAAGPTEQVPVWQTAQFPIPSAPPSFPTDPFAAPSPAAPPVPASSPPFPTPSAPPAAYPPASSPSATYPPASVPPAPTWGPAPTYTPAGDTGGYPAEHPMGTPVLIVGILGLVLFQLLGPVAWVMGNKALREIDASPGRYTNRGSVVAGRICGIIATALLVLAIIAFILLVAGAFAAFRTTS